MTIRQPKYHLRTDTVDRLVRIGIGLQQQQDAVLLAHGVTRIEAGILTELLNLQKPERLFERDEPKLGTKKLAQELMCSEPTVSEALSSLEKRAVISRKKIGRRVEVELSDPTGILLATSVNDALAALSSRIFFKLRKQWHPAIDALENRLEGVAPRRSRRIRLP